MPQLDSSADRMTAASTQNGQGIATQRDRAAAPATDSTQPCSNPERDRAHPHVHSEESLQRIVNRLSRIEGHVRGIKTMVRESRPCPEVLVQIAAIRGALDRVSRIILDEHLTQCIAHAAKDGNIEEEIEELKSALDRFLPR